jgi:transposase
MSRTAFCKTRSIAVSALRYWRRILKGLAWNRNRYDGVLVVALLVQIGEDVREVANVIPEQIWVKRHIYPKYACHTCERSGYEQKLAVRIAEREPDILQRSIATPSLIAFILVNKFVDHLPFCRQEKRSERSGLHSGYTR